MLGRTGSSTYNIFLRHPCQDSELIMFTKTGILELHTATHERLDLLLRHIATVPDDLYHKPISGFGHASIWKQLVHILTCEEGWVHDLQNKTFPGWHEEDCRTMADLLAAKDRVPICCDPCLWFQLLTNRSTCAAGLANTQSSALLCGIYRGSS